MSKRIEIFMLKNEKGFSCYFCGEEDTDCFVAPDNEFNDEPSICEECVKQLYTLNKETMSMKDLKKK